MNTSKESVLIIVGQDDLRNLYEVVAEHGGFEPIGAGNGLQGVELFKENPNTSLVVVEQDLSDISGAVVAERIRQVSGRADFPQIIGIEGIGEPFQERQMRDAGVNSFVRKWPTPGQLINDLTQASAKIKESRV
jgi:two-component system chemotaxis sensor kinase CheA